MSDHLGKDVYLSVMSAVGQQRQSKQGMSGFKEVNTLVGERKDSCITGNMVCSVLRF